jgi:hypothetical protein
MSILLSGRWRGRRKQAVGDPHIQIIGSTAVVPALAAPVPQDRKGISIERNVETQSNRISRPKPNPQPGAFASGSPANDLAGL